MIAGINVAIVALLSVGLAMLAVACSSDPPAQLPDNVTVAIVYNEQAERWHAGAIVSGDRPTSSLRVVCLTEPGIPGADVGREHAGINVDAMPGEPGRTEWTWSSDGDASGSDDPDGLWGLDWSWRLDGQPWTGGRWKLSTSTRPATAVAASLEVEAAFLQDLRDAQTAELIGSEDGEEALSVRFDLTSLFNTPVQFAVDQCNRAVIEERAGDSHSAYAYWLPDFGRHSLTLSELDPDAGRGLLLSCGPAGFTDDDAPDWIRNAQGEVYAVATLMGFVDVANHTTEQADTRTIDAATVSWTDGDGNTDMSIWDVSRAWMLPAEASSNLRFIDALLEAEELIVAVEVPDASPLEIKLHGATMIAKPLGSELDACIREYADLNG